MRAGVEARGCEDTRKEERKRNGVREGALLFVFFGLVLPFAPPSVALCGGGGDLVSGETLVVGVR